MEPISRNDKRLWAKFLYIYNDWFNIFFRFIFGGLEDTRIIVRDNLELDKYLVSKGSPTQTAWCLNISRGIKLVKYFDRSSRFEISSMRFIDIGCGSGKVLYGIEKLNYKKIYGIEINKFYFETCKKNFINKKNIEIINQDFFDCNISDIKFFYIFSPFVSDEMYEKLFNILQKLNSNIIIICFDTDKLSQKLMLSKDYECIFQKEYLQKFTKTQIYKKIN